jgi:hypothetical protein
LLNLAKEMVFEAVMRAKRLRSEFGDQDIELLEVEIINGIGRVGELPADDNGTDLQMRNLSSCFSYTHNTALGVTLKDGSEGDFVSLESAPISEQGVKREVREVEARRNHIAELFV